MVSSTDTPVSNRELHESLLRRPEASGLPVRLADGCDWLLAVANYRVSGPPFTHPDVDAEIDRIFEGSTLRGEVTLTDIWSAARKLLLANYDLDDSEFAELVGLPPRDLQAFADIVIEAIFGPVQPVRSYLDWARASLLANGILPASILPGDLANVLSILVATRRTITASQFIDASREVEEQALLEYLV